MRKLGIRFLQIFIVTGASAILAGLAVSAYPPLLPAALAVINRSPNCRVLDVFQGAQARYRFAKARTAIAESARLLERDGELERWQTSEGDYWIPAGNGEVLPVLLAQQQADEYGNASQGVRGGDIVLDCGAHVGVYTRKALKAGARLVVAIEPAPVNVECLRRNLSEEISAGRVILYPKGVWDKEELLPLLAPHSRLPWRDAARRGRRADHEGIDGDLRLRVRRRRARPLAVSLTLRGTGGGR